MKRTLPSFPRAAMNPSVSHALFRHLQSGVADGAFLVVDIGEVLRKLNQWRTLLPQVEPFYAIKCNNDPHIARALVDAGCNFDCASRGEIRSVVDMGCSPSRIVYANPVKQPSHIKAAREAGVKLMTFDNGDELDKIKMLHPNAELLLRIKTDDSYSLCTFSSKFGAELGSVSRLLRHAKNLDLNVVGVSYHVGSGCSDRLSYEVAIRNARLVFDLAASMLTPMHILDIGGGFPGSDPVETATDLSKEQGTPAQAQILAMDEQRKQSSFVNIAATIQKGLADWFPVETFNGTAGSRPLRVIAEPGRYMVETSAVLMANIIGRRQIYNDELRLPLVSVPAHVTDVQDIIPSMAATMSEGGDNQHQERYKLYLNDGVYGTFNNILYDHATVAPVPIPKGVASGSFARFMAYFQRSFPVTPVRMGGAEDALANIAARASQGNVAPSLPQFYEMREDHETHIVPQSERFTYPSSVYGCTCDGMDKIVDEVWLPEMQVGDWLYFENVGAYTYSSGSYQFNGFEEPDKLYVNSEEQAATECAMPIHEMPAAEHAVDVHAQRRNPERQFS